MNWKPHGGARSCKGVRGRQSEVVHRGCIKKLPESRINHLRSFRAPARLRGVELILKYRGRWVTEADVALIRRLIADNPAASRFKLSKKLCEAWNWVQPNGVLRDMVCRGLMLELERAGHIR